MFDCPAAGMKLNGFLRHVLSVSRGLAAKAIGGQTREPLPWTGSSGDESEQWVDYLR
jgi:hypothetical protein